MMPAEHAVEINNHSSLVFPPSLVPVLRERFTATGGSLEEISDAVLVELLTTIFFAGLGTYEGEHHSIGVVFLGRTPIDLVVADADPPVAPLYRWKIVRFETARPFAIAELVKLAVADADHRILSAVHLDETGRLAITGLALEGFNSSGDPFVRILASRPGCLSIRSGRDLLIGYEHGTILTGGEDVVFAAGPVRHALEAIARNASVDDAAMPDYLDAVRSLVREMAAHGHGGLMVISPEERPFVQSTPYRMALDSSIGALLRLARRIDPNRRGPSGELGFAQLLRNAFMTETERVIEEVGALSAVDGALMLNRSLALIAFGAILRVGRPAVIVEALDADSTRSRTVDFGSRGTRHRAAATYAGEHPGAVVFVASEDGQVSCLFRDRAHSHVLLWRLGPADVRGA
jgi:sensor domain DACNV-containing protein/DisA checkpoint controller-like protein